MKVMVTGGAGFIGSHLCARLVEDGHSVICVDNLATGSITNLEGIDKHRFVFVHADVVDMTWRKVDCIYHLACPASPVHYQKNPIETTITSVSGTYNVLKMASKNKARILFTSTSEVYGDPEVHPQREDYFGNVNPIGERSCYDEGKRCAESLCGDFNRLGLADVRVARIFNTYGPKMAADDGRVVSNFITQALNNKPLTIYGKGTQTRSLCYVSDMVDGLIKLMNYKQFEGPVNLGNPNEMTMLKLAGLVLELTNSKSKTKFSGLPSDDPTKRKPDIRKAWKTLGWKPVTNIKTGLEKTIEYFQQECKKA